MPSDETSMDQNLITEARNPATSYIDLVSTLEMVRLINYEDSKVAIVVGAELPQIAKAIDAIAERMRAGGRLIYLGAGTSGRLGMLDASECPPTFNTSASQVIGVLAGGTDIFTQSKENAEDDAIAGKDDICALDVTSQDSVVGIAASGRTPYTLSGMAEARNRGALVVSIACNHPSPMANLADISIAPITGPEVINGSTRLKAGTAQKMVLNMISTGVMIRLGKTYSNLMVDVQPNNAKLRERSLWIIRQATGLDADEAASQLEACGGEVKVAIVATLAHISPQEAARRLALTGGFARPAIQGDFI